MPDSYVEIPNGNVYIFNGYNRPRRWDGVLTATEVAGIEGPLAKPTIGPGGGVGPIIGEFNCYLRFLDRYGNVSNVSPVSEVVNPRVLAGERITNVTNASPMVVTTAQAHGLGTGQIVQIQGVYGCDAANDYWTVTVLTPTTFQLDESTGNGSYNSGGFVYAGTSKLVFSNLEVPTDSKVTRRQVIRNQDGSYNTYYVDIDTDDLTSTQLESTKTSADLAGMPEVPRIDSRGVDQIVERYTPPPSEFACVALQGGRIFAAVIEPFTEGCISVTNGSRAVTLIGGRFGFNPFTFAGRVLTVRGATKQYFISSVESATSLTLDVAYQGSTDPYAKYAITPDYEDRRAIRWSEPTLYEAWPPTNQRLMPEDANAGEMTGLFAMQSFLYITTEYTNYRLGFYNNPNLDGGFSPAAQRGCVNHRCTVVIADIAYQLDYQGVHAFMGNDDDNSISAPIKDLFRAQPNCPYRINWRAKKYFHAVYCPSEGLIRWFVALGGEYTPHHALVCDFARKRWAIERYAFPVGASCTSRMVGRPQVLYGSLATRILAADVGTMDGPPDDAGTNYGTCTDAGASWIEDSTAEFSSEVVGFPVSIVEGRGRGQQRLIYAVTGDTRLEVRPPFSVQPDSTSVYQVGGIPWVWRSGWFEWADSPNLVHRRLGLMFGSLNREAGLAIRHYDDVHDEPLESKETKSKASGNGLGSTKGDPWLDVDCTDEQGRVECGLAGYRDPDSTTADSTSLELSGVQGPERQTIWGVELTGAEAP